MATLTGTTLGKYQILERLGRGGMADVYRAHHTRLDRDVAIKVLHPHLIEGQDFLARFEREAKAVASLKHPHIVQVFDFDSQDELHYLVMELIDGGSLRGRLEELAQAGSRPSREDTLRIFGHVASALDYAHRRGMLHRDVKPANVLLEKDGDAYLSDFGIARILSQTQFTTTGALIGTPHYMSPEQARGEPLTEAADLYSLGVVLYEMLTGRLPYDADTPMGVIHKHLSEPLPPPRSVCPDLPAPVDALMLKALAKEAGGRFGSGADMLQALELALSPAPAAPRPAAEARIKEVPTASPSAGPPSPLTSGPEELTISAMPTVAMGEAFTPDVPPAGERAGAPPAAASTRRARRWVPVVAGLVVVALAAIGATIGLSRRPQAAPATPASAGPIATVMPTRAVLPTRTAAGPGDCATLADCIAWAKSSKEEGSYQDAIVAYRRAQNLVPSNNQPAYAFLWCDTGSANVILSQPDAALENFQACIDRTQGSPATSELRTRAQTAIHSLLGGAFAERSADYGPGANASASCSDPTHALGPPDFDPARADTYLCLGVQGYVELMFLNNLPVDGPGRDILVFGDPASDDMWHVDVSADGDTWLHFGPQPEAVELDLAEVGLSQVRFIRFTDTGRGNNGAELDAVEALNWEPAG